MNRPLTIAHVTDSAGVYGAESVMLDLCEETRRAGDRPVLFSIAEPGSDARPVEIEARRRGIDVRPLRMQPGLNVAGARAIAAAARDEGADVFHTHGYKGDILLALLPRATRAIPIVATVHGYTDVSFFDRLTLYRWIDGWALRRVDRVVLVHHGLATRFGPDRLKDPRWRVIENGIQRRDAAALSSSDEIVTWCQGAAPVIGAVGRLSSEKGFDLLLQAAAALFREHPNGRLVVIGEGPERGTLEQITKALELSRHVLLPGYRANARDYLHLFDVFVLSSLTEGLPITILEAMQAGIPIVATRVGGVPHVLDEGLGGSLVDPASPSMLTDAIRAHVGNPDRAVTLAHHARATANERFTSVAMASRYLDLYRELVS